MTDGSFSALGYTVSLTDTSKKIAVSLVGFFNQRKSHLCLASFPLSHSTPNLAARIFPCKVHKPLPLKRYF